MSIEKYGNDIYRRQRIAAWLMGGMWACGIWQIGATTIDSVETKFSDAHASFIASNKIYAENGHTIMNTAERTAPMLSPPVQQEIDDLQAKMSRDEAIGTFIGIWGVMGIVVMTRLLRPCIQYMEAHIADIPRM